MIESIVKIQQKYLNQDNTCSEIQVELLKLIIQYPELKEEQYIEKIKEKNLYPGKEKIVNKYIPKDVSNFLEKEGI